MLPCCIGSDPGFCGPLTHVLTGHSQSLPDVLLAAAPEADIKRTGSRESTAGHDFGSAQVEELTVEYESGLCSFLEAAGAGKA